MFLSKCYVDSQWTLEIRNRRLGGFQFGLGIWSQNCEGGGVKTLVNVTRVCHICEFVAHFPSQA